MAQIKFRRLTSHSPTVLGADRWPHVAVVAAGLGAALYMEMNGHHVTGMTNQIVWGLPHVFAVFLIVSASGALNVASVSSVFNRLAYKPFARLSGILAMPCWPAAWPCSCSTWAGPTGFSSRMTTYNFNSIFAWNIYLYTGFVGIVAGYLFSMMDRRVSKMTTVNKTFGWAAFTWRLILTTGTGSIFGFLVARDAVFGGDHGALVHRLVAGLRPRLHRARADDHVDRDHDTLCTREMIGKFRGLLIIFSLTVLFLTVIPHVSKFYAAPTRGVEAFLLRDGGIYPLVFWGGQIFLGNILRPVAACVHASRPQQEEHLGARLDPLPDRRPGADVCRHHRVAGFSAEHFPRL